MSLVIHASGLKGAAYRAVREAVETHLEGIEDQLTPEQRDCVDAMQAAANKLIARTPQGRHVDVQLLLAAGPFGALEMSVAVSATRPRSK